MSIAVTLGQNPGAPPTDEERETAAVSDHRVVATFGFDDGTFNVAAAPYKSPPSGHFGRRKRKAV
jgi:hypothetical protein